MFDPTFAKMSNVVNHNGKSYFVDTNNTFDAGLETMIFGMDGNHEETDNEDFIDFDSVHWNDLYCEHYSSAEAAVAKHKEIVSNIGKFL